MIKYLLLFILPFSLYASKILSYNIYERSDRADVMITFDTPYHGVIKESKSNNKIIIKLQDATIESSKTKKVNSNFLHSLIITPMKNQTQLLASISPNTKLVASKTADAYGLRLRFNKKVATQNSFSGFTNDLSALPTKKDEGISTRYYIVVGILIIGIIILLALKKKLAAQNKTPKKDSWLFNANQKEQQSEKTHPLTENTTQNESQNNVSIRFQKAINSTNSVVMLDFGSESYLVLMGNSNILLDKFQDNIPATQQEFESVLQDRNRELEDFLGSNETKEPLQAYKERAASLIYSEDS